MLRKDNLVLTFAKGPIFDDPCFWAYIHSLKFIADADFVLLSDDASEEAKDDLDVYDVQVVRTSPVNHLFRDRHLAYWNYLNDHGHKYRYIVITDCRDVIFQHTPIDWIADWKTRLSSVSGNRAFLDEFVILTSEGFRTSRSGFSCVDNFEFQSDVPKDHLKELKDKWVVNGGVSVGTPEALKNFHFLVWTAMLKTRGRCTDQAAINYLMSVLEEDATYSVSFPQHDWLCLTGEGVKEGVVEPRCERGILMNPMGRPYCILHQWDRLNDSLRQDILAHLE